MLALQDIITNTTENAIGKGLGFAVHGEETKKALARNGVVFMDDAPVAFHQIPSFAMKPVEGKVNILYTACETEDLPKIFIDGAKKADLIICTSDFVAKIYKKYLPYKPVATVPLGVDSNIFSYTKRNFKEPFIYLWVGAPDFRKGYDLVLKAWEPFALRRDMGLIMKTTDGSDTAEASGNIIVERRKLPWTELARIYHFANCFIFPSYSEGFGLPLAEAMATGLPCLFTPYGGVTQFANKKNAFPLKYKMVDIDLKNGDDIIKTKGAMADVKDIVDTMRYVRDNYKRALIKGKNAARDIDKSFSWNDTGRKIKAIIEEFLRHGTVNSR